MSEKVYNSLSFLGMVETLVNDTCICVYLCVPVCLYVTV